MGGDVRPKKQIKLECKEYFPKLQKKLTTSIINGKK